MGGCGYGDGVDWSFGGDNSLAAAVRLKTVDLMDCGREREVFFLVVFFFFEFLVRFFFYMVL